MTSPQYVIKQATVLSFALKADGTLDLDPRIQDVLVTDGHITEVAEQITIGSDRVEVIDARNQLLIPGFVNAPAHSVEIFEKGRYEAMPLELWMLYRTHLRFLRISSKPLEH